MATLADTIGTSPQDVAEYLAECDEVNKENKERQWSGEEGLTHLLRELVEVG